MPIIHNASESETSMWKNEQFLWSGSLAIFFLFLCLFLFVRETVSQQHVFNENLFDPYKTKWLGFPGGCSRNEKKRVFGRRLMLFTCTYKRHSHDGYFIMFYYIFCLCSSVFFFGSLWTHVFLVTKQIIQHNMKSRIHKP